MFSSIFEVFDSLSRGSWATLSSVDRVYDKSFPPLNVLGHRDERSLRLEFALAGITEDRLKVSFEGNRMILDIAKAEPREEDGWVVLQQDIRDSAKRLSYVVPRAQYDVDNATATFRKGILTVEIPARESAKPRTLEIQTDTRKQLRD